MMDPTQICDKKNEYKYTKTIWKYINPIDPGHLISLYFRRYFCINQFPIIWTKTSHLQQAQ